MKKSSLLNFLAGPVCRQKGFGMVTFRNLFDFLFDLKQLERIVTQRIPCFSFASAETLLFSNFLESLVQPEALRYDDHAYRPQHKCIEV